MRTITAAEFEADPDMEIPKDIYDPYTEPGRNWLGLPEERLVGFLGRNTGTVLLGEQWAEVLELLEGGAG